MSSSSNCQWNRKEEKWHHYLWQWRLRHHNYINEYWHSNIERWSVFLWWSTACISRGIDWDWGLETYANQSFHHTKKNTCRGWSNRRSFWRLPCCIKDSWVWRYRYWIATIMWSAVDGFEWKKRGSIECQKKN